MSDVTVRVGTASDVVPVMEMAFMTARENGVVSPDKDKVLAEFWPALNLDHGVVGIIGEAKKPEGYILLRIGTMWYTTEPTLEERVAYVVPQFRNAKGGRARKLCEFAKMTAEKLGLPLTIGVLSNIRTEAKIRLYRRIFGEPAGAFWLWGTKTGEWQRDPLQT